MTLFESMRAYDVRRVVFSSSATVYGMANEMPLRETSPTGPVNPYGHSKLRVEQILLGTWPTHTRAGASYACGISIQWVQMKAD
jgi:UDP-glucose 4-epimerase